MTQERLGINNSTKMLTKQAISTPSDTARDIATLFFVYAISYGLMLANRGIFWDDWVVVSSNDVVETMRLIGVPWVGYFFKVLSLGGPTAYRALTFASYLFAALCFYALLKRVTGIDAYSRLILTLFFLLFPVNHARPAECVSHYAFSYFLFFFGFWLTSLYLETGKTGLRIASLTALFLSFTTNSMLPFYSIVIIYILYINRKELNLWPGLRILVVRYFDYVLIPFVFFAGKMIWFRPSGEYKEYNEINFTNLLSAFPRSAFAFKTSFFDVIDRSFSLYLSTAVIVAAIVVARLLKKISAEEKDIQQRSLTLFAFGAFAFFAGVFAYCVVNKVPHFAVWQSRFQLLVPLGSSFMLVYGMASIINNGTVKRYLTALLIVLFICANAYSCFSFQKDWYKQVSLIRNFSLSPEIQRNTAFLIEDKTTDLNANGRWYAFYEYTALFKEAFNDETRFGENAWFYFENGGNISSYSASTYIKTNLNGNAYYKLSQFEAKEPDKIITISHGKYELALLNTFQLMFFEFTNRPAFDKTVLEIVILQVRDRISND